MTTTEDQDEVYGHDFTDEFLDAAKALCPEELGELIKGEILLQPNHPEHKESAVMFLTIKPDCRNSALPYGRDLDEESLVEYAEDVLMLTNTTIDDLEDLEIRITDLQATGEIGLSIILPIDVAVRTWKIEDPNILLN